MVRLERHTRIFARTFGTTAEYTPRDPKVAPAGISGTFSYIPTQIQDESGVVYSEESPCFDIKLTELAQRPLKNDRIRINGRSYIVRDIQETNHDMVRLLMAEIK